MFFPQEQREIRDAMIEEEVGIEAVMTGVGIKDSEVKIVEEAEMVTEEIKDSEVKTVEEADMVTEEIKDSEAKTVEEAEIVTEEIKDSEVKTVEEAGMVTEEINKLEMVIGTAKVVATIIFHSERNVTDVANQKVEAELVSEVNEGHKEGRTVEVIHVEDLEIMATVQEIIVVDKEEAEVQTILEIEIDAENT